MLAGLYLYARRRHRLRELVRGLERGMGLEALERTTREAKRNDVALERDTTRTIAGAFMLMCCASFLSLSLVLISYVYGAAKGDVVQATPPTLGQAFVHVQGRPECEVAAELAHVEFLYTGSWARFTSLCCCRDAAAAADPRHANISAAELYLRGGGGGGALGGDGALGRTELWTCPDLSPQNGLGASEGPRILHKLRARVDAAGGSTLHLRPFCHPTFAPAVGPPAYDAEALAYVVSFANGTVAATSLW